MENRARTVLHWTALNCYMVFKEAMAIQYYKTLFHMKPPKAMLYRLNSGWDVICTYS